MFRILTTALVLILSATGPALSDQGKGKGKGNAGGNAGGSVIEKVTEGVVEGVVAGAVAAVLSDEERRIIRDYFHDHAGDFGGVKPLPPGIRQKLARGGTMPPGIAKQALPGGLYRQLPPRDGQAYHVIGTDVVLVHVATQAIVDVLKDVLRGG